MSQNPDEIRTWEEPQDPDRAVDDMRRAIERAREQVRDYRKALSGETGEEA